MYFRNIFRLYFKKSGKKLILGRWGYPENDKILEKKIYLANHDNCGPCGKILIKYLKK